MFGYENGLVFPIYVSDQKFEWIYCFLLIDHDQSHYVDIKDFTDFILVPQNKFYVPQNFCRSCLQCFSSKNVLTEHKEDCLCINGKQSVKLEEGTSNFENYFK